MKYTVVVIYKQKNDVDDDDTCPTRVLPDVELVHVLCLEARTSRAPHTVAEEADRICQVLKALVVELGVCKLR